MMYPTRAILAGLVLVAAITSISEAAPRFVPHGDQTVGTLGADNPPTTLNGEGKATTQPAAEGSLLGGKAIRLQVDAGNKPTEFWIRADIALSDDVQRLSFWAFSRGIAWTETRAVFQDPSGSVRAYKTQAISDSPWTLYHVSVKSLGEPVVDLPEKATADGRWHFRGITLRYQPFAKGGLTFGEILTSTTPRPVGLPDNSWSLRDVDETLVHQAAYTGFRFGYESTTLPAAVPVGLMISPARQAASISWQLRSQDGLVIDAGRQDFSQIDAARDDFVLPTLPAGNYWLRVKLRAADGALLNDYEASYLVHRSTASGAPTPNAASAADPPFDAFWPGQSRADVDMTVAAPKPVDVPLARLASAAQAEWTWLDATSTTVTTGQATLTPGAALVSVPPPPKLTGPQRYQLQLRLKRGEAVLDQRTANIFVAATPAPFTEGTRRPARRFVLKETDMRSIRADQKQAGLDFIANAAANNSDAFLMFYWDEIEPRKGFLQFEPMDARISAAARAGVGVIPTLGIHLDRVPRWLWYPVMLDQGLASRHYNSSFTRKPSPASSEVRDALAESARQIVRHYKDSPAIVGWNFTQGVESFWSDASRNGFVVDFSPTASRAFAAHLRENGRTLQHVADELKRPVATWDDVTPPAPEFTGQLDLRPLWLEWERFKQRVPRENFQSLLSAIRAEDKTRPIFVYAGMGAGDLTTYTAPFAKLRGTICFGGGDSSVSPYLESIALGAGVDFDAESAAVPPFQPQLLLTIFNKLSHGATRGGTNIMWGRFFDAGNTEKVQGSRRAAQWVEVIDRIGPSEPVWADVAVGTGMRSIINRTRSFMWNDWMNLNEQSYNFANMIGDTIANSSQVGYVTDETPLEQLKRHAGIVFLEAPLLGDDAAGRLAEYVRSGGKLLLQGETGRYDENGAEHWTLRRLLDNAPADGKNHRVGKGLVRWNATPADWRKPNTLAVIAGDLGYKKLTRADRTDVRSALRKSTDGQSRFLILFRKTWPTGNPKLEQLGGQAEPVKTLIRALPPGKTWNLTSVVDGKSLGERTSEQLIEGLELNMKPADLLIIRLDPK